MTVSALPSHDIPVKPRQFETRLKLLYTAIFLPLGLHLPYFPLWLAGASFSPAEIAVILSGPMFLRVATTPIILTLADRARDRVHVLTLLCAATLAISGGYFLPPTYGGVLAFSLALAVVWPPHSPLADSLALSGVRRFGSDYSRMRIFGSIAYLAANFFGGFILAAFSEKIIPLLLTACFAGTLAAAAVTPRLGRPRRPSPLSAAELPAAASSLATPYFASFVAAAGLIQASHALLYGFSSIYWKSLGISDEIVGLLWSVGVVAEIGVFALFTRLFGSVPASRTLIIAALSSILRWIASPLIWPAGLGVAGFMAIQALHALSTGLILLGLQKMLAETVGEERMGAAQGITYFASNFGLAVVTLLSGPLYAALGAGGFYVMALIALAGLALALVARRSAPQLRLRR